jgi:hypothetical protein
MQTMGSPGVLLCRTQGKHKTVWVGPSEKQIVSGPKYKVGVGPWTQEICIFF